MSEIDKVHGDGSEFVNSEDASIDKELSEDIGKIQTLCEQLGKKHDHIISIIKESHDTDLKLLKEISEKQFKISASLKDLSSDHIIPFKEEIKELSKGIENLSISLNNENSALPITIEDAPQEPKPKRLFERALIPCVLICFITMFLLSLAVCVYSLMNLNSLNEHWNKLIKEKMQTAIDIEQSIDFFEETKEKKDARQSD